MLSIRVLDTAAGLGVKDEDDMVPALRESVSQAGQTHREKLSAGTAVGERRNGRGWEWEPALEGMSPWAETYDE